MNQELREGIRDREEKSGVGQRIMNELLNESVLFERICR